MSRENSVCWSTFLGVVLWCVFIHLYKPTERHVLRSRPYVSWGPGAAQHRLQRLWFGQGEEEEEGCPGAAAAEDGGRKTRWLSQKRTACLPLRWDQSEDLVWCPSCKAAAPHLHWSEGIGHLSLRSFPPSALELLETLFEWRQSVTIASACFWILCTATVQSCSTVS